MNPNSRKRGWGLAAILLLGAATAAYAQFGGGAPIPRPAPVLEYTSQEVQANLVDETLTALGKEKWEIFQVLPIYKFTNQNGENELIPQRFRIFGRRPAAAPARNDRAGGLAKVGEIPPVFSPRRFGPSTARAVRPAAP